MDKPRRDFGRTVRETVKFSSIALDINDACLAMRTFDGATYLHYPVDLDYLLLKSHVLTWKKKVEIAD